MHLPHDVSQQNQVRNFLNGNASRSTLLRNVAIVILTSQTIYIVKSAAQRRRRFVSRFLIKGYQRQNFPDTLIKGFDQSNIKSKTKSKLREIKANQQMRNQRLIKALISSARFNTIAFGIFQIYPQIDDARYAHAAERLFTKLVNFL